MKNPLSLIRDKASRGALSITAGVGAGQLIILLVSPVLTRLFDPEAFGQYAVVVSVLTVLTIPATLRLEAAIPLAASDAEARDVLKTGLLTTAIVMTAVAVSVLLFSDLLLRNGPVFSPSALWCLVPGVAAFACYELLTQFAIRQRRYAAVGARSFIQNVGIAGGQIALGASQTVSGLNWGQVFGKVLAVGFMVPLVTRKIVRSSSPQGPVAILRKFSRFPLLTTPSSLFNALGTQAPYLLIGLLFGAPAIGFLGLIQRIFAAPQALIGQAIGQVFVGEAAIVVREGGGDLLRSFKRASRTLAALAVPLLIGMVFIPDSVLVGIFGGDWEGASRYVQAASIAFVAQFIVSPISQTLILTGRQGLQLVWDVLRLALVSGSIFAVSQLGGSALEATWVFSVASGVSYLVLWILCRRTAARSSVNVRYIE